MIAFYENGTYEKIKDTDTNKNASFYAVDISTDRKGPLYTLVENPTFTFHDDPLTITIGFQKYFVDAPIESDIHEASFTYNVNSVASFYNIYPLIKQMYVFNNCQQDIDQIQCEYDILCINYIRLQYANTDVFIDEFVDDKDIDKTFKHLKMKTNTSKIFKKYQYICLYEDHTWEFIQTEDEIPKYFKKIMIYINDTDSVYIMKHSDYIALSLFDALTVKLSFLVESSFFDSFRCVKEFQATSVVDYLGLCLFIPQLVLLEQNLYNESIELIISLESFHRNVDLYISEKESTEPRNVCLYKLLTELVKMKL